MKTSAIAERGNQLFSDKFEGLQQPSNRLGILDVREDPRIKEAVSPDKEINSDYPRITYKKEGNSSNSWKPIRGHKMTDSFQSRYKMMNSNPLNSGEAIHKRPTLIVSQGDDASELTRHQIPDTSSEEDTENEHFRHNNFASGARNLAAPANEKVKDEPLHISLYHSTNDAQAIHLKNTNPFYNQKQNFAAPKYRQFNDQGAYNTDKYDAHKMMEERLPNRFRKMIHNKNEDAIKSASTGDMFSRANGPDIHQETDLNDDNGEWEHGLEETLANNEEMESNPYDTINDQQNSFAHEYMPQDFKDEEESDDNRHAYDKDGGDENYDTTYDNAHKIQETLKSDGSNIGRHAIYQTEDDGVHQNFNQVAYSAKMKDGTRYYKRSSSSTSSENETEDNKETENIIQSRIEDLKDRIRRKMNSNIDED